MPSNFTENFNLSQWEPGDKVQRTDFNADNAKLDAALKAEAEARAAVAASVPRFYIGKYTGSGTWGANNPNSLTFPFPPKVVIIVRETETADASGNVLIQGQTISCGIGYNSGGGANQRLMLTWSGNTLSWYTTTQYPSYQLNAQNVNYCYLAIG